MSDQLPGEEPKAQRMLLIGSYPLQRQKGAQGYAPRPVELTANGALKISVVNAGPPRLGPTPAIILSSTSESIVANLAGAVATNEPSYHVAYEDVTENSCVEGSGFGALNNGTDVVLIAAPAAGVKRLVRSIWICNTDTTAVVVTVRRKVGSDYYPIAYLQTLATGQTLNIGADIRVQP